MIRWYILGGLILAVLIYHGVAIHNAYEQGKSDCEIAAAQAHGEQQGAIAATAAPQNAASQTTVAATQAKANATKHEGPKAIFAAGCVAPDAVVRDVNEARR